MKSTDIERANNIIKKFNEAKSKLNQLQTAEFVVEYKHNNMRSGIVYINKERQHEIYQICEEQLQADIQNLVREGNKIGLTLV